MKKTLTKERVYALKGYTVKVDERGRFFVAPTYDQQKFAGPYKSLQHATTAIARKLQSEFTKRHKRLEGVR